jgi:CRISPR-associated endonuclease/helicase Cas3
MSSIKKIKELSASKKVLIIVNTIRRANELCDALMGQGANPFLLHSMFVKEDRDALESAIKLFSAKEGSGVWITTQLAEASLDIDFDVLFTELSALDSLLQRMGRVFRQRKYTEEEPNIVIYTDDCSGIGTIYDEDIFELSQKQINRYNGLLLTEQEKTDSVRRVYSYEAIKDTDYYNEFKKALGVLDNILSYELSKREVQRILRDIYSVKVIPVEIWKTFEQDLKAKIQIVSEPKLHDKKELLDADRFINNKTIDVPVFRLKKLNNPLSQIQGLQGISLIRCKYDRQKGLLLTNQGSNLI